MQTKNQQAAPERVMVGKKKGTIIDHKADKYQIIFDGEAIARPTSWFSHEEFKRIWK